MSDHPESVIGIGRGEKSFAVAVTLNKRASDRPRKGMFCNGVEIKALKGKYHHIRIIFGKKIFPHEIKSLKGTLSRKTNQRLHTLTNEIITYASQFEKPVIALEGLTDIRKGFRKKKKGKTLTRRMNSLPFHKLQVYLGYKALREGIPVGYFDPKNSSKDCHRFGTLHNGGYNSNYTCSSCGLTYDRDLNASINIGRRITSSLGCGALNALNSRMRLVS